jgi:hypothetical protein
MKQEVQAVGFVEAIRPHAEDDFWGGEEATIALTEEFNADALQGLADFSHVEVLFVFHEVEPSKIVVGARHPRNNRAWPAVGIFAQRGKNRPNRIGSTIAVSFGLKAPSSSLQSSTQSMERQYSTSNRSSLSSSHANRSASQVGRTNSCASTGCRRSSSHLTPNPSIERTSRIWLRPGGRDRTRRQAARC